MVWKIQREQREKQVCFVDQVLRKAEEDSTGMKVWSVSGGIPLNSPESVPQSFKEV